MQQNIFAKENVEKPADSLKTNEHAPSVSNNNLSPESLTVLEALRHFSESAHCGLKDFQDLCEKVRTEDARLFEETESVASLERLQRKVTNLMEEISTETSRAENQQSAALAKLTIVEKDLDALLSTVDNQSIDFERRNRALEKVENTLSLVSAGETIAHKLAEKTAALKRRFLAAEESGVETELAALYEELELATNEVVDLNAELASRLAETTLHK